MQKNNRTRKRTSAVSLKVHTPSLSEPFRQKLSNGITVIGENIPAVESVAIGVWVNFGSRDERKEENGLTHLIEHMVFKGTEHFTADEIVGTIEDRGGYINAFTTKEFSCYYAKVFKEDLEETVHVLSDLVLYPKFDEHDLRSERKVVLTELQEVYDDPEDWGMDYIEEKMFGGNSLSMPIIGRASGLRRFTSRDLKSLHSKKFTADRIVISVAGNFNRQKLMAISEDYFSAMPVSSRVYIRKRPVVSAPKKYVVRRELGKQAHIIMGAAMPGANDPDRYAASTLGVILGDGSSSRLYKSVREKDGLAYSIYSYGSGYADTGVMGVYACTAVEDIDIAENKILSTIGEFVKNGPTEKEVVRAKAQLKAGIIFSLENLWDRASLFARDELYYREKSRVSESLDSIERITDEEIAGAAERYLGKGGFTTLKILPQSKEKLK
jgi:predicted Zn-dependent peptidase